MRITKRTIFKDMEPSLDIEWFDRYRGQMRATLSIDDACSTIGISKRSLDRKLKTGFTDTEHSLIKLACCGRLDQFDRSWAGFTVVADKLVTPLGKELSPTELEQYTFQMSLAMSYKVELRKIQEQNRHYKRLLDHYGSDKVVEISNHKKSTA